MMVDVTLVVEDGSDGSRILYRFSLNCCVYLDMTDIGTYMNRVKMGWSKRI